MKKIFATALFALFSGVAGATTITFDPLEQAGSSYQYMSSYSESGFDFTSGDPLVSAQQGKVGWYFGSASLFSNSVNGYVMLTRTGGATFNFDSIDLAPVATNYGADATVNFTGHIDGGGTVNESFTLNGTYAFQTFTLTGFDNLDSVTWLQASPFHQFDNLVLDPLSTVPEPGSVALIGLALAILAATRRKSYWREH